MERLFEFLFKYRPVIFERGDLVFDPPWSLLPVLAIGLLGAGLAVLGYYRAPGRSGRRDRVILTGLRLAALAVLMLILARPMLVISTVVPQQNFLGILIDDSRSMRIADRQGRPRSEFVTEHFGPEGSELLSSLSQRFKLRFFRFSEASARLGAVEELTYAGTRTDLGRALDEARRELAGVPLAGLVVISDGAHNATQSLAEGALQLQAAGVPVHVVGVGRERFARDIEVRRVEVPRTAIQGSSIAADVSIVHSGFQGETVRLVVEDAGRIVHAREVELPPSSEAVSVRVQFKVSEPGPRTFRFSIPPRRDEMVAENNARDALIVVEARERSILYFEGEPRFEVKFIRRAVAEDENLRVVVLQRTAQEKFYRLDVEGPDELAGGFPKTREELFQYEGLILGSVEASFFTHDQLRMIAEFVDRRGGGLLALGGRLALDRGGYANTPVAEVLPVVIPESADTSFFAELKVGLTPFGRAHAVTQLSADPAMSARRWSELPELSTLNRIVRVKPGASTLLLGESDVMSEPLVVMAYHRFGRGKAILFSVQDSWLWQMHADVPLEDETHETLWRQLLRWLVTDVPDQVTAQASAGRVGVGSPVNISAGVADSGYVELNGAHVVATVVSPSGAETVVPMEWTVRRDGEYGAEFVPLEQGLHEIHVEARRGSTFGGSAITYVSAGDPSLEYFDATMHARLLEKLASETGGRFYTEETVGRLPEDVSFTESGATVREERDLWDMPALLILLLGLIGAEWALRRSRGLA